MAFGRLGRSAQIRDWKLSKRTVSRQFRAILEQELPGLGNDERLWTMLEYLLFPWRDDDTKQPLAPSELMTFIGGTPDGGTFLQEFSDAVMPLTWSDTWNYVYGKCRVITSIKWPASVRDAFEEELLQPWNEDDRVYLRTGTKRTKETVAEERAALAKAADDYALTAKDVQKRLLRYMNDRAPNAFSKIVKQNIEVARDLARQIDDNDERWDAHMTLRAIQDQPKPYYRPSRNGNTLRIFGINESILALPREIRHALTDGWIELDLRNVQVAIAAMLWNIESINAYLETGQSIWDELLTYFSGQVFQKPATKDILKQAVYQIVNGGSKFGSRRKLKKITGVIPSLDNQIGQGAGKFFFQHLLIRDLWRASRQALQTINANKGAYDSFGDWIALTEQNNVGSVIAQQCQSYELRLLLPILQEAERTDQFIITLWQHDGFSIAVRDVRREETCVATLKKLVAEEAHRLGIRTALECDDP